MARDPAKRFTIRVGKRPARSTSIRSARAQKRASGAPPPATRLQLQDPMSAPAHSTAFLVPPMAASTSAPPKPKGLFKRIAARFRANSNPGVPPPPAGTDFTDREARTAALRARGLLPPADLSAQEAERDAALALAVPAPDPAPTADGAPSAAQRISERWRRRHSLHPTDERADSPEPEAEDAPVPAVPAVHWEAASSDRAPPPALAPLPPPPRRRLSTSVSAPALHTPASETFGDTPFSAMSAAETFATAQDVLLSPTAAEPPRTPRRAAPPPPIVLTPSRPSFDAHLPTSPSKIPLPPSPGPSLHSLGDLSRLPPAPLSPKLLSPATGVRARSDTGTTLPSLAETGETADDASHPPTPPSNEPAHLPSVLEDSDDDEVAPLPPRSPTAKTSPVSRSKSTLRTLGRKLTSRRAPPPRSSTLPPAQGLSRAPSTRLNTTALHDRGTIAAQTGAIADDEQRRLAEMAFLDF